MTPANPDPSRALDRFGLLASGIAGRRLGVAPAASGGCPWTDGSTIFVDPDTSVSNQVAALAVQASLITAGSLEPGVVRRLGARRVLARRYLAVEGHRALAANSYLLPHRVRLLIDRDVAARVESPAASLAVALGGEPITDPPHCFGVIKPRRLLASRGGNHATEPARAPQDVRRPPWDDARHERDEDIDNDDLGRIPQLFSNNVGGRGALARLFQRMLGLSREPDGGLNGAEAPRTARLAAGVARSTRPATGAASTLEGVVALKQRGTTYPEWDVHRTRYRPNWCTVTEVDPRPGDPVHEVVTGDAALRRPLARLGLGLDRCHRQLDGDDLDIDAAVEEQVEILAGSTPDEAVYVENRRRRHDLAVLVMLDISGSSSMPSVAGDTVHEQQRASAAALMVALHSLGSRVALYGFSSHGRSAVRAVRVKRFDDGLDARVLRRLGALVPGAYTRLGAAIRHGASVLEQRGGTPRRLLAVLSDGLAYDHGYEGPYAEADARRALAEARRRGTGCLCLSVGSGTDLAALRRVFGTAAHATIAQPDDLVRVVGPLFRAALRSAEFHRRVAQREPHARQRRETPGRTS
jgi:nitric oxide reductase NorD protein